MPKISKSFEKRVLFEGDVFTRRYRYIVKEYWDRMEIQRLPVKYLDTTEAINGWETVKVYE